MHHTRTTAVFTRIVLACMQGHAMFGQSSAVCFIAKYTDVHFDFDIMVFLRCSRGGEQSVRFPSLLQ